MSSVKGIGSRNTIKWLCCDSFFTEFLEDIYPISLEEIHTKRTVAFMVKCIHHEISIVSENGSKTRCEEWWKHEVEI